MHLYVVWHRHETNIESLAVCVCVCMCVRVCVCVCVCYETLRRISRKLPTPTPPPPLLISPASCRVQLLIICSSSTSSFSPITSGQRPRSFSGFVLDLLCFFLPRSDPSIRPGVSTHSVKTDTATCCCCCCCWQRAHSQHALPCAAFV